MRKAPCQASRSGNKRACAKASVTFLTSRARGVHIGVRRGRVPARPVRLPPCCLDALQAFGGVANNRTDSLEAGKVAQTRPARKSSYSTCQRPRTNSSPQAGRQWRVALSVRMLLSSKRAVVNPRARAPGTNAGVNPSRARRQKRNTCW
jgi:hypothetical protein